MEKGKMMKIRKSMRTHRLAGFLTMLIICACLQLTSMQTRAAENTGIDANREETVTVTIPVPADELPDSDELFTGYVEKIFYQDLNEGISVYGNVGGDRLQGEYNKKIYAELKKRVAAVAAGTVTSTEFLVELGEISWSAQELGVEEITEQNIKWAVDAKMGTIIDSNSIVHYLLMDCPYELYWFDKTKGMNMSYYMSYNSQSVQIDKFTFPFTVAQEYRTGNNMYTMNNSDISRISTAVSNAKKIVELNKNKSDYEKLMAYRKEICDLTSYNDEAMKNDNVAYGNPWQLIWVFDGDSSTEVVCEGYSKAFQYLCDLSNFDEAVCYTVMGTMDGGRHMWNLVSFGEKSYLVDVTNCDAGSIGADTLLFLVGAEGSVASGYTITCWGIDITYKYDVSQKTLYGEDILTLSKTDYKTKTAVIVTVPTIDVTYGDSVDAGHIKGTARTADGKNVPGTFSWAPDVMSYGSSGTKMLEVVFCPDDTDSYEKQKVYVEVVVKKRPVSKVTVEIKGDYKYTGSPVIPEIQVKAEGTVLKESDYIMELFNNTDVGTAIVRISPKPDGNYTWTTVEKKFLINPTGAAQGTILKSGKITYKVTKNSKDVRTVAYVKPDSSKSVIKVPNTVKEDGVTYKVTSIEAKAFKNNKKITSVTIGSNVTSIGAEAFSGCTKLTKVTGCNNVLTVGDKAFYGCKKLKQVGAKSSAITLSKVRTIGKSAFYNCQAIKKVNLTSTALTKIGNSAFYGCTSMTSFTEKSTKLASIGSKAFYKDKKLASITLKSSKLTKSNVGTNAFKGIKSTCKIKVPSKMVKTYKTLFRSKGAGTKVKVMK